MKILIAEDDSTSAIVLRKALEKLGHTVVTAADGEQAYNLLQRDAAANDCRVVISDWMMPGMDGVELTRKLRVERQPGDPYRFVILLTARGRPEDRRTGLEAGADDFMVKPLDMGDLIPRLSIAERMIALEDAVSQTLSTPAPSPSEGRPSSARRGGARGDDASLVGNPGSVAAHVPTPSLPSDGEGAGGERAPGQEAARTLLLSSVRDHDASELHLEPQPSGAYKARVRRGDGTVADLAGNADAAPFFLALEGDTKTAHTIAVDAGRTVFISVAVHPQRTGKRITVRVLSDTATDEAATLDDLPMSGDTRDALRKLLAKGLRTGGVLRVIGRRDDARLIRRTVVAFRNELSMYLVVDDFPSVLPETGTLFSQLVEQNPQVVVLPASSTNAYIATALASRGVFVIDSGFGSSDIVTHNIAKQLLATLTIRNAATGATDRYELTVPGA